MANNEVLIPIPGRLHSVATEGHVAGADEIYDDTQQKDQGTINSELISAVGTGGSVDSRIAAAVNIEKTRAEGAESTLDGRVDTLEDAVGTGGSVDSRISAAVATEASRAQAAEADRYTKSETYTKTEVNGLVDTPHQEYVTVEAYANLPATGSKDTIYRVSNYNGSTSQVDASVYSEYAWNGSQYVFLCVKSQIGEVFDISVYNNNAKYADLAAALNGGANIPQSLQKGGMSVKFVQSSDNNYVQARCTANEFTTDVTKWQGVDEAPVADSKNLVESGGVFSRLGEIAFSDITSSLVIEDKYVNPSTDALSNGLHHTAPIHLNAGEQILISAKAGSNVAILAITSSTEEYYLTNIVGKDNANFRTYNFVAIDETYVTVSYIELQYIKLYQNITNKTISELYPDIFDVDNDITDITSQVKETKNTGYVNPNTGGISGKNSVFWHSSPIQVLAGSLIRVTETDGVNAAVTVIASSNGTSEDFIPLVVGRGASRKEVYMYLVKDDSYITFSYRDAFGKAVIIKNEYTKELSKKVTNSEIVDYTIDVNKLVNGREIDTVTNSTIITEADADLVDLGGITSDGSEGSSHNIKIYHFINRDYKYINAEVGNIGTSDYNIAFYNSLKITSQSFISGLHAENSFVKYSNVPIPAGTKMICITHRYASYNYMKINIVGFAPKTNRIDYLYNYSDFGRIIENAKKSFFNIYDYTTGNDNLLIVHFSDIHNSPYNLQRIKQFYDLYSAYIDDVISTGDNVFDKFSDDFSWWADNGGSLFLDVIGNHDAYISGSDYESSLNCYNKYFKDYIQSWNVVQPSDAATEGLCYYYKDYNSEKVRIIALDCMHYNEAQNNWFVGVLNSAKVAGLSVVVLSHYIAFEMEHTSGCTFDSLEMNAVKILDSRAADAVDVFISNGGDFVCWLAGHTHNDFFGVGKDYPKQVCICIGTAKTQNGIQTLVSRSYYDKSADLFNLIGVDTTQKVIKIVRIGADYDRLTRHIGTLCYNYETKQLVYNN